MKIDNKSLVWLAFLTMVLFSFQNTMAQQTLSLSEAIELGVSNYETIKSKELLAMASRKEVSSSKTLYMPDFTLSAQQFYGTANSLHGPQYGFGEGITSMGAPQSAQNWDAAFSSLYLANFNWNIYSFGARRGSVKLTKNRAELADAELEQEIFQHQIKIASAYLNLLAIREIVKVQTVNVERSKVLLTTVESLTSSGIRPDVELSTAEAELAGANIALFKAREKESVMLKELIVLLGTEYQNFVLDESLLLRLPQQNQSAMDISNTHPTMRTKDLLVEISKTQSRVLSAEALPKLNIVGAIAGRGSGFEYNYAQDNTQLSRAYGDGVGINRVNYLLGLNLSWSITGFARNRYKNSSQKYLTNSLRVQRNLAYRELSESLRQANEKIDFTLNQYSEVQKQTAAAAKSYVQYESLYKNGLTTIDDLVQSMYNLVRAESDRAVIQINVWQAYLMQKASSGDIEVFINQIK